MLICIYRLFKKCAEKKVFQSFLRSRGISISWRPRSSLSVASQWSLGKTVQVRRHFGFARAPFHWIVSAAGSHPPAPETGLGRSAPASGARQSPSWPAGAAARRQLKPLVPVILDCQ